MRFPSETLQMEAQDGSKQYAKETTQLHALSDHCPPDSTPGFKILEKEASETGLPLIWYKKNVCWKKWMVINPRHWLRLTLNNHSRGEGNKVKQGVVCVCMCTHVGCRPVVLILAIQCGLWPTAKASLESLLVMQNIGIYPKPTKSEEAL